MNVIYSRRAQHGPTLACACEGSRVGVTLMHKPLTTKKNTTQMNRVLELKLEGFFLKHQRTTNVQGGYICSVDRTRNNKFHPTPPKKRCTQTNEEKDPKNLQNYTNRTSKHDFTNPLSASKNANHPPNHSPPKRTLQKTPRFRLEPSDVQPTSSQVLGLYGKEVPKASENFRVPGRKRGERWGEGSGWRIRSSCLDMVFCF